MSTEERPPRKHPEERVKVKKYQPPHRHHNVNRPQLPENNSNSNNNADSSDASHCEQVLKSLGVSDLREVIERKREAKSHNAPCPSYGESPSRSPTQISPRGRIHQRNQRGSFRNKGPPQREREQPPEQEIYINDVYNIQIQLASTGERTCTLNENDKLPNLKHVPDDAPYEMTSPPNQNRRGQVPWRGESRGRGRGRGHLRSPSGGRGHVRSSSGGRGHERPLGGGRGHPRPFRGDRGQPRSLSDGGNHMESPGGRHGQTRPYSSESDSPLSPNIEGSQGEPQNFEQGGAAHPRERRGPWRNQHSDDSRDHQDRVYQSRVVNRNRGRGGFQKRGGHRRNMQNFPEITCTATEGSWDDTKVQQNNLEVPLPSSVPSEENWDEEIAENEARCKELMSHQPSREVEVYEEGQEYQGEPGEECQNKEDESAEFYADEYAENYYETSDGVHDDYVQEDQETAYEVQDLEEYYTDPREEEYLESEETFEGFDDGAVENSEGNLQQAQAVTRSEVEDAIDETKASNNEEQKLDEAANGVCANVENAETDQNAKLANEDANSKNGNTKAKKKKVRIMAP